MTQAEVLEELAVATLVQFVIYNKDGEAYRLELRRSGITRLIKMIERCRCDEEASA